jgi:hypothetical protein
MQERLADSGLFYKGSFDIFPNSAGISPVDKRQQELTRPVTTNRHTNQVSSGVAVRWKNALLRTDGNSGQAALR